MMINIWFESSIINSIVISLNMCYLNLKKHVFFGFTNWTIHSFSLDSFCQMEELLIMRPLRYMCRHLFLKIIIKGSRWFFFIAAEIMKWFVNAMICCFTKLCNYFLLNIDLHIWTLQYLYQIFFQETSPTCVCMSITIKLLQIGQLISFQIELAQDKHINHFCGHWNISSLLAWDKIVLQYMFPPCLLMSQKTMPRNTKGLIWGTNTTGCKFCACERNCNVRNWAKVVWGGGKLCYITVFISSSLYPL